MSRLNFYDLLESMAFDYREEYARLYRLFAEENSVFLVNRRVPLIYYVETMYFRELKFRKTFTSVNELILKIIPPTLTPRNVDDLFLFCEFLLAVLPEEYVSQNPSAEKQASCIIGNIIEICEKTNHRVQEKDDKEYIIVEKSKESMQAAALVTDRETAIKIIEYNHYALKGQTQKKREILNALGQYIEPALRDHSLKNGGYSQLESDIGFLLNNFHVRHNNKTGSKAQDYIVSLGDDALEEWYDKCYNSILSAIIIIEQIKISSELKQLKENYSWRT